MPKKVPARRKNPAAVALGRKGGAKSRAYMTPEEASELGRRAVMARWERYRAAKAEAESKTAPPAARKGRRAPAKGK